MIAAKKSLDLMVALYRKRIWTDAKTVNVLASALFADVSKIKVTALKFFLSSDAVEEEEDSEEEDVNAGKTYDDMLKNQATKKTKKRQNMMKKQLAREKKKAKGKQRGEVYDFAALHLLHDPQGLCEKMFKDLKGSKERWEVQLMQMNLISRLVSIHELILLNFYPYLERYLWPTKPDVTQVLAYVAQACHEYVPPDALESVLLKIAYVPPHIPPSFALPSTKKEYAQLFCVRAEQPRWVDWHRPARTVGSNGANQCRSTPSRPVELEQQLASLYIVCTLHTNSS